MSQAGGQAGAEPDRVEHAAWAADEAEFNAALATDLKDDLQAFCLELRSGYIPGTAADYKDVIDASRAEIRAVESYATALRTAAADGAISDADREALRVPGGSWTTPARPWPTPLRRRQWARTWLFRKA